MEMRDKAVCMGSHEVDSDVLAAVGVASDALVGLSPTPSCEAFDSCVDQ